MAIIKDFYSGRTHIRIYDTYTVKTQEEKDKILNNIAEIWTKDELKHLMQESGENKESE